MCRLEGGYLLLQMFGQSRAYVSIICDEVRYIGCAQMVYDISLDKNT